MSSIVVNIMMNLRREAGEWGARHRWPIPPGDISGEKSEKLSLMYDNLQFASRFAQWQMRVCAEGKVKREMRE